MGEPNRARSFRAVGSFLSLTLSHSDLGAYLIQIPQPVVDSRQYSSFYPLSLLSSSFYFSAAPGTICSPLAQHNQDPCNQPANSWQLVISNQDNRQLAQTSNQQPAQPNPQQRQHEMGKKKKKKAKKKHHEILPNPTKARERYKKKHGLSS